MTNHNKIEDSKKSITNTFTNTNNKSIIHILMSLFLGKIRQQ